MKFNDIEYVRPDIDAELQALDRLAEGIRNAGSYEEMRDMYVAHDKAARPMRDMFSVAKIRNSLDTKDPFYIEEVKWVSQARARIAVEEKKVSEALLDSPYAEDFSEEFGEVVIKDLKGKKLLASEEIIDDKVKEQSLQLEYSKLTAGCVTEFRGEQCNFYDLLKHMESTDRQERKEAYEAWADLYAGIADKTDEIYDGLVKVRCDMAEKLGFDSYIEMAYMQRKRYDYNAEDVAKFREQVREVIVPACEKLYEQQRERLGIDRLCYYDEEITFPDGNAVPAGGVDELLADAEKMYSELAPETKDCFMRMLEDGMFDLGNRPGKQGGGYSSSMVGKQLAFIFANFNGTGADVEVLTHEFGHAFAFYSASRSQPITDTWKTSSEVAEIHSMTMEFWTTPWMDMFFKTSEDAEKYVYTHLVNTLTKIPYIVCVDEFQHRVFENPDMTSKERREVWKKIEKKYLPWRDWDGNEFLESGGFWQLKHHIFDHPFYYIDYAMAQLCAFQFYSKMKENRDDAWQDYLRLCCSGGSKGYYKTLEYANLEVPLKDGAVERAIQGVLEDLFPEDSEK